MICSKVREMWTGDSNLFIMYSVLALFQKVYSLLRSFDNKLVPESYPLLCWDVRTCLAGCFTEVSTSSAHKWMNHLHKQLKSLRSWLVSHSHWSRWAPIIVFNETVMKQYIPLQGRWNSTKIQLLCLTLWCSLRRCFCFRSMGIARWRRLSFGNRQQDVLITSS